MSPTHMPYGHDSIQYGTDSGTESVDCAMNTWHSDKMEGICADDVEGLLEQFLQYERQASFDVAQEENSTGSSTLSSRLTRPQSTSVLAAKHISNIAPCSAKHTARSTTAHKTKDPYCKMSPRKRQIQCEFSALAVPKKRNAETSAPLQQSPLRVSAPTLTELLTSSTPTIHMKGPVDSVPGESNTDQGGVQGPQSSCRDSRHHLESKDLRRPDVEPTGSLKSVNSTESNVHTPHSAKTRTELLEGQQSRRTVFLGNLLPTTTETHIVAHFSKFGDIEDVTRFSKRKASVWNHYAFLTYKNQCDANRAISEGSLPDVPNLNLSYGDRRHFCGQRYFDHDTGFSRRPPRVTSDFDTLIQECARRCH